MTQATQTIPAGYKQTEIGVIPMDWDIKKLKDIANYRRGSFPQPYGLEKWYDNNFGMPFVQVVDVDDNFKLKNDTKQKISKLGAKLSVFVKKGTIILTIQGSIGRVCITQYDSYVDRTLLIFESFKEQFDKYFFMLKIFRKFEIEKEKAPGGIIKTITKEALSGFEISYPQDIKEQTAIATALSDTDALIEKLEKLIAKKKAIKQGAMQQLLTGKKRLPRFSGEWEMKKLGEVCYIRKGQLITESTRIDGNIPVIAGGKTPAYFHNKANRHGKTITISGSGASAGYVAFHKYPIFASDCSTIEESRSYSIEYIYFLLQSLQDTIYKMQTGGAQPHIHPNDLNPIIVSIPKPEEQTAIATVLSDMDTEIEKLENKLGKYRQIKTGMMQQLLTGKIRLLRK